MATVIPPPSKRQKVAAEEKARIQQEIDTIPDDLGNVRVQFIDRTTGGSTGGAIALPLEKASAKNLERLLNSLLDHDDTEHVPYRFAFQRDTSDGSSTQIDISHLYHSIIKPGLRSSTEELITLIYTPQSVFRVRAVSRSSASISGHAEPILALQFSSVSSARVITGSGDHTARIMDCDTGTPLKTLKGHTSWVLVVTYSPDGSMIATGSMDKACRLWDSNTGEALGILKGHTQFIRSIAWEPYHLQAPGKPRLASASKDATVRIWDAVSRRVENVLCGHKASVSCVRWGGTGNLYTSSQDKLIKIWDPNTASLIATLSAHAHWINSLALSTDFVLRTAYHDHTGHVPATTAEKIAKAKERFEKAATINGEITERLVSASDDQTLYLWHPSKSQKPITRLLGHQKQVNHVVFSPNGLTIASSGFDNHIKLWNATDGKFLFTLKGHVAAVYMSCFSADSRLLVSGSKDTTLKVWDVATGKLKEDLPGHRDEVYAVDWSPDGAKVGSGGKDKAVKIWRH